MTCYVEADDTSYPNISQPLLPVHLGTLRLSARYPVPLSSGTVCRRVPVAGLAEFGSAVRTRRSHMSLCVTAASGPDFTPVTTPQCCSRRPGRRGGESDTDRRLRCPRAVAENRRQARLQEAAIISDSFGRHQQIPRRRRYWELDENRGKCDVWT